jgi:dimethylglycine dehydrogenase
MRQTARVVVIGGGVVGASVLYHLAKAGWSDILLVERDQLTSGSTWHAAGGMHTLNSDPNVAKLQAYTIELYQEIEELSGQSCGVHLTGGVMLAGTKERLDLLKAMHAKGRYLGMKTEVISAREAAELMPLLDPKHFTGALFDPIEGHVDPYGVTHAYVKAARLKGAEVVLQNRVVELNQRPDATWDVVTEQGTIHAEHVVNAGGLWAREVGRMVGLELPVLAMEHQYLITEDMPEVLASPTELLHAIDFEAEIYLRQERGGMLLGTYERAGVPWSEKTTPWDFSTQLLPEDLDRIAPSLEVGFEHFPAIGRAGIKRVINGPFTFAPDGNPLVGPVRGLPNYWCACAVMAGFSQGGGVGLALANWITQGDPGFDVWAMDVARYGPWATPGYTNAKVRENYSRRFRITFPNEELPAARPLKTTPIYDLLVAENAVMGVAYGQEHALWFAPPGTEPVETVTFGRSNAHAHVAGECRAVREAAGLIEISNFAKYRIEGPGAEAWLARLLAGRIPEVGRISLTPMLNDRGRLIGDFTLARLAPDRFLLTGSGIAESYHLRWFEQHLPTSGVALESVTDTLLGLERRRPREPCRPGGAHRRGPLGRGLPVPRDPAARTRPRADANRPHQLHRRPRLRDLGRGALPPPPLPGPAPRRRRSRPEALRRPCPQQPQAGEGLRQLGARIPPALRPPGRRARPLRRLPPGRLHRPPSGRGRDPHPPARDPDRPEHRHRRHGRRADLARRPRRRLGDLGRLRPPQPGVRGAGLHRSRPRKRHRPRHRDPRQPPPCHHRGQAPLRSRRPADAGVAMVVDPGAKSGKSVGDRYGKGGTGA